MQSGISLNLTFGTFMCIYSIVIVTPRHNLKICHIQNILDVAMRQISKIFSIILSKNILYLFENLLFLRDFKMCQRSFFFRKTNFKISQLRSVTSGTLLQLTYHCNFMNSQIQEKQKTYCNTPFNSEKLDTKTKTTKLMRFCMSRPEQHEEAFLTNVSSYTPNIFIGLY